MTQQPQGQSDGSPVGWVAPEQPTLLIQPFSSNSVLLQYSSAHPHVLYRLIGVSCTAACVRRLLSMFVPVNDLIPSGKMLQPYAVTAPSPVDDPTHRGV